MMLISFSSEHTHNAYDDGVIGDSYLWWIPNCTKKINETIIEVDHLINLTTIHEDFKGEKIEGLCVTAMNEQEVLIDLISDNDNGQSKLFKVSLSITA